MTDGSAAGALALTVAVGLAGIILLDDNELKRKTYRNVVRNYKYNNYWLAVSTALRRALAVAVA